MLVLQALQFLLLARVLGADEFGRLAAANALITILIPLAGLGYGNVLLMRVARAPAELNSSLGSALFTTAALGLLLTGGVVVVAAFVYGAKISAALVAIMAINELFWVRIMVVLAQMYQALDKAVTCSVLNAAVSLCRIGAVLVLFFSGSRQAELWAVSSFALLSALGTVALLAACRSFGRPVLNMQRLWEDRSEAMHFSLGSAAKALYTDLDKVVLAHVAPPAVVGAYTAAYRLIVMAFVPVRSLLDASAASFFRKGSHGVENANQFAKKLLGFTLPYSLIAAVVMLALADAVPLVLGASFERSVPMLRCLAILPVIQAIHYVFSDVLTTSGLQALRSRLQWLIVCVYAVLAAIFIPRFGWQGAAGVCLLSESLFAIIVTTVVTMKSNAGMQRCR